MKPAPRWLFLFCFPVGTGFGGLVVATLLSPRIFLSDFMQINQRFYDNLSRLLEADYSSNRNYQYQYDLAGNKLQDQTTIGITTTTTDWTYNAANQMATMQIGANPVVNMSYDNNGNLTDDGVLTYTWDSANRLKTLNNGTYNTHFAYDGNGDRHQQNVGGTITNYLLDVQPELALVLGETVGVNTTSYVHAPMGVHSAYNGTDWTDMVHDGLGSVRSQVDATGAIVADQWYDPYGQVIDDNGTWVGSFGYAGEQTDESGLGYNRARYYDPSVGTFASLDPFEGVADSPMSINGYSYVHGNPTNWTDPTGKLCFVPAVGQVACAAAAILYLAITAGIAFSVWWATQGQYIFSSSLERLLCEVFNNGLCNGDVTVREREKAPEDITTDDTSEQEQERLRRELDKLRDDKPKHEPKYSERPKPPPFLPIDTERRKPKVIVELGAGNYKNAIATKISHVGDTVYATNKVSDWELGRSFSVIPDPDDNIKLYVDMYRGFYVAKAFGINVGEDKPLENQDLIGKVSADVVYTIYPYPSTYNTFGTDAAQIASTRLGTQVVVTGATKEYTDRFVNALQSKRSDFVCSEVTNDAPFGRPESGWGESGIKTRVCKI